MKNKFKILITAPFYKNYLKKLSEIAEVRYKNWIDNKKPYSDQEIINMGKDVDILVVEAEKINYMVINELKKLKLVCCTRGTPVNVDLNMLKERNIPLVTTPGRNATSVAELTIGFIIMGLRYINESNNYMAKKKWVPKSRLLPYIIYKSEPFKNTIVGIIGYGNIGKEVARILKVFNFNILVYDPYVKENLEKENIDKVDLDYLIRSSDVITIHCSMNAETKNLIRYSDFLRMKRTAILINTARAAIVNQMDLKKALKSKLIKAAYLDVYEKEPLDHNDELYLLENVYMTPHIGGASKVVEEIHSKMICEDIINYMNNNKLQNEFIINS